jgi:hypothetical protein
MSRRRLAAGFVFAALVAACSPSVTLENTTPFEVRAIVVGEGGTRNVLLVRPGEVSLGDLPEGAYRVAIVPEQVWADTARAARDAVAGAIADPDRVAAEDIERILLELDLLGARADQLGSGTAGGALCEGSVDPDGTASVSIFVADDGSVAVACSGPPLPQ